MYLFIFSCAGSSLLLRCFSCCGVQDPHCGGLSCCWSVRALECVGFSSCSSRVLEHRINSCGAWAELLHSLWDVPGSGTKLVSPALAGGFFTTELSGLPYWLSSKESVCNAGDAASITGSGRSPEEGNGNPFQYSCLEIPWIQEPGEL